MKLIDISTSEELKQCQNCRKHYNYTPKRKGGRQSMYCSESCKSKAYLKRNGIKKPHKLVVANGVLNGQIEEMQKKHQEEQREILARVKELEKKIDNQPKNLQNAVTSTIGTVVGNQLSNTLTKDHYDRRENEAQATAKATAKVSLFGGRLGGIDVQKQKTWDKTYEKEKNALEAKFEPINTATKISRWAKENRKTITVGLTFLGLGTLGFFWFKNKRT